MGQHFNTGKQRRQIEDEIVARFHKVDFKQKDHAYLEDDAFWDYVFSWYELVRYYELSDDTAIGAHMLDLYAQCGQQFKQAASDSRLRERRRDKAADAIYQITYYVDRLIKQAERNGIQQAKAEEDAIGRIQWRQQQDDESDDRASLN